MDWLTSIVNSPIADKGVAVILVFVLLRFLREDLGKLASEVRELAIAVRENTAETKALATHNTTRMDEIRAFMREVIELWSGRHR